MFDDLDLSAPNVVESHTVSALPHQARMWGNTDNDVRMSIVGPLGCGKTFGLAVKALVLAKLNKGHDGLLVVPTFTMFRMVHLAEWPGIWSGFGLDVKWSAGDSSWEWPWGGKLWVRSAENPARLAGPNLAFVMFDEPGQMRREAWERASVRARHPQARHRQVVCGGTPEGLNWFADYFASPEPPYVTYFGGQWHPDMGHYYDQIVETYGFDESLLDAYARGLFVPLRVGRVYRQFRRDVHVMSVPYDDSMPLHLSTDFNVDRMRWGICQVNRHEIRVIDEIALGAGSDTAQAAEEMAERWGGTGRTLIITGDSSGENRSTKATAGKTDYRIMREILKPHWQEVVFRVPTSNPSVKDSVDGVNYHLAGRGRDVVITNATKRGKLVADSLIRDLERVVWKEGSSVTIDDSDITLTHSADWFRYLIWRFARPAGMGTLRSGSVSHHAHATVEESDRAI